MFSQPSSFQLPDRDVPLLSDCCQHQLFVILPSRRPSRSHSDLGSSEKRLEKRWKNMKDLKLHGYIKIYQDISISEPYIYIWIVWIIVLLPRNISYPPSNLGVLKPSIGFPKNTAWWPKTCQKSDENVSKGTQRQYGESINATNDNMMSL